jgi:hypothetical protein
MIRPIPAASKTNIGKVREKRVDEHHLELGLSRKQELRLTARVKMPVSFRDDER